MFNSLTGTITGKFSKQLFIDTNGIEWDVTVPETSLEGFPSVGSVGKVYTWMNHYENGMDLYGFASMQERSMFLDLLKVDGIGPKGAIKIMSSVSVQDLITVLEGGDVSVLEKIQGIGKKTAAKMMLTLKGKLTIPVDIEQKGQNSGCWNVVVQSLCDMGYDKKIASDAVQSLGNAMKMDAAFEKLSQQEKEDALFKKALIELAN